MMRVVASAALRQSGSKLLHLSSHRGLPAGLHGSANSAGASGSLASAHVDGSARESPITLQTAKHPAFRVVGAELVEEYSAQCTIYEHIKTGAQLYVACAVVVSLTSRVADGMSRMLMV